MPGGGVLGSIPSCRRGTDSSGAAREAILTVSARLLQLELKPSQTHRAHLLQFIAMGIEHIATAIVLSSALLAVGTAWFLTRTVTLGN